VVDGVVGEAIGFDEFLEIDCGRLVSLIDLYIAEGLGFLWRAL
jgi:hypothetical protein